MSAGRFDYTGQYAAQKGGVFLIRIECVDASDAPVAITGTVEFTLWRTKNAGAPLLEKELTVAANAAEVMLSEAELDAIAVGEYAYRIRQVSSAASLLIGGAFAVLPPGTGVVHLNSLPVRVVIGGTVVRVLVAAPGAAGADGEDGATGPAGPAGPGPEIGGAVAGGTAQSVPFFGAGGVLAEDNADFRYDAVNGILRTKFCFASNAVNGNTVVGGVFLFGEGQDTVMQRSSAQRMSLGSFAAPMSGVLEISAINKKPYTVGTLPLFPVFGDECLVTNALTPVLFQPVVAGGAVTTSVRWDTVNWVVIG